MNGGTPERTGSHVADEPPGQSIEELIPILSKVFKLLGDETRLRIVLYVSRIELNVSQLCGLLNLSQPLVSSHIALLRDAEVLHMRCEGKHHYYSVQRGPFARLMDALALAQPANQKCDCFLECMLGNGPLNRPMEQGSVRPAARGLAFACYRPRALRWPDG